MKLSQLEVGDKFTIIGENMGVTSKEGIIFVLKQKYFTFYEGGMIHCLCDEVGGSINAPFYLDPNGKVKKLERGELNL